MPTLAQTRLDQIETRLRQQLAKLNLSPAEERRQWSDFYSRPQVRQLRALAGRPEARTRREEVSQTARRNVESRRGRTQDVITSQAMSSLPFGLGAITTLAGPERAASIAGGIDRALLSIPTRAAALLTGQDQDVALAETRVRRDRHPGFAIGGEVLGSIGTGMGASAAVRGGGRLLANVAPRAGNFIQGLTRLERGQRLANAAKIVTAGGAGGAAQAAGEGSDVGTGTLYGAGGAAALGGGIKLIQLFGRPVADVLHLSSLPGILRRFTTTTREKIAALAAQRRAEGVEPTFFELLPANDRRQILNDLVRSQSPRVASEMGEAIEDRVSSVGPQMASQADRLTAVRRANIESEMVDDLTAARGAPDPADRALAERAAQSPTDMNELRDAEARAIMAPYDDQVLAENIDALLPRGDMDDELAHVVRSAIPRSLLLREHGGIKVREVSDILSDLRAESTRASASMNKRRGALNAIEHIENRLKAISPDMADAVTRMRDAFAKRSRMSEGVSAGRASQRRDILNPENSNADARVVRNAFNTPEGSSGRALGQYTQVTESLSGTPAETLRSVDQIAQSGKVGQALATNLGDDAGSALVRAAQAQNQGISALSDAANLARSGGTDTDAGKLFMDAILAIHPSTFVATRAWALNRLSKQMGLPESKARALIGMMFSRDPVKVNRAINMLHSSVQDGQSFLRDIGAMIGVGQMASSQASEGSTDGAPPLPIEAAPDAAPSEAPTDPNDMSDEELLRHIEDLSQPTDPNDMSDEELLEYLDELEKPYGRSVIESIFPGVEVTDDLRDPNSDLGRTNPGSRHNTTDAAVDVRPIPGMTFEQFLDEIRAAGYEIASARDEVTDPSAHATGPHWHVVLK